MNEIRMMISRTSDHSHNQPHIRAVFDSYVRIDKRWAVRPEDITAYKGESQWWYEKGRNHRVDTDGNICRDFDDTDWFITFRDIDDFFAFVRENEPVVLSISSNLLHLEIYDDWRE